MILGEDLEELEWGAVFIADGPQKGRIGNFDDEHFELDESCEWHESSDEEPDGELYAIVYFGHLFQCRSYYLIPHKYLRPVTIKDLLNRSEVLQKKLSHWAFSRTDAGSLDPYEFTELMFIHEELNNRFIRARYREVDMGKKVFISHSSKDKHFAKWLCSDLSNAGHSPWLDEWEIKVGESIPEKIEEGVDEAHYVIVVLSENAINSKWVEREWHSKYWDEIESGDIQVLPVLFEECKIPRLLKMKKYADFSNDYNSGLDDVLAALAKS